MKILRLLVGNVVQVTVDRHSPRAVFPRTFALCSGPCRRTKESVYEGRCQTCKVICPGFWQKSNRICASLAAWATAWALLMRHRTLETSLSASVFVGKPFWLSIHLDKSAVTAVRTRVRRASASGAAASWFPPSKFFSGGFVCHRS